MIVKQILNLSPFETAAKFAERGMFDYPAPEQRRQISLIYWNAYATPPSDKEELKRLARELVQLASDMNKVGVPRPGCSWVSKVCLWQHMDILPVNARMMTFLKIAHQALLENGFDSRFPMKAERTQSIIFGCAWHAFPALVR